MRRACLAFTLLSPLLACPGDDTGETDSAAGSSGAGTAVATSTGEPATSTGSSGAMTTTGSSGPPADGGSSSGGDQGLFDACTTSCERLAECDVQEVPNCGIPCNGIEGAIAGCEAEYLAQQLCVAALSCEDLQAWADAMMTGVDYPCENEDDAFQGCLAGDASSG